jgi:DNA primase
MDFVEQVKSSVDIVRLVGEYVRLKKNGNRYVGLCPFHTEKTPSFGVNPVHQYFKCFGCGVGGDIFKFVMQLEGVTFFEALKSIAERNGIPMPKRAEYVDPETKQRAALLHAHEIAAQLFQSNLNSSMGAHARQYLSKRGVTPESIAEFGLGLSADSWDQLTRRLEQEGLPADLLEHSGLVSRRQESSGFYDRFRARLMFPIHDESGRVIGFGGRALKPDDEPKYLNSPKTSLYDKSNTLYNLHRAKKEIRKLDRVVLVEGYMDAIGVHVAGVHEVVASCGTALTNLQVRALKRHSDRIVVNFDPDTAGANASEKSIQMLLDEDMRVRVLELAGDLDPDEYVKQNGAEAYRETLDRAPVYYFWLADRMRKKFDTRTAEGRMDAWKTILPAIERIHDRIERAAVAKDMAGYLGVDEGLVLERFRKATASRSEAPRRSHEPTVPPMEKLLLNALLKSADAQKEILPALGGMDAVKHFVTRNIFEALLAVSGGHGDQHSQGQAYRNDKTTAPLRHSSDVLTFSNLEARLGDADKDLLSRLVFADEGSEENLAVEQARDCMRVLVRQDQELRRSHLKSRVQAAERSGDLAEGLRLSQELHDLEELLRKQRGR